MAKRAINYKAVIQMALLPNDVEHIVKVSGEDFGLCWRQLVEVVGEGYKLSLQYDESRKLWGASIFCTDPDSPNAGFMLYANGGTPELALCGLWYKHVILADKSFWGDNAQTDASQTVS